MYEQRLSVFIKVRLAHKELMLYVIISLPVYTVV